MSPVTPVPGTTSLSNERYGALSVLVFHCDQSLAIVAEESVEIFGGVGLFVPALLNWLLEPASTCAVPSPYWYSCIS